MIPVADGSTRALKVTTPCKLFATPVEIANYMCQCGQGVVTTNTAIEVGHIRLSSAHVELYTLLCDGVSFYVITNI